MANDLLLKYLCSSSTPALCLKFKMGIDSLPSDPNFIWTWQQIHGYIDHALDSSPALLSIYKQDELTINFYRVMHHRVIKNATSKHQKQFKKQWSLLAVR